MAVATAQVAFNTARTLLNDDAGTFFTNAVLQPKMDQAFRELIDALRINDASIMFKEVNSNIAANTSSYPTITDLIEPVTLWERPQASASLADYVPMTEYEPLPNVIQAATLRYWAWDGNNIQFIAASANRTVKVRYWRSLTAPTSGSSSLIFIQAEDYLAPRIAALEAGSLGQDKKSQELTVLAKETLKMITDANRGRQAPPGSTRP